MLGVLVISALALGLPASEHDARASETDQFGWPTDGSVSTGTVAFHVGAEGQKAIDITAGSPQPIRAAAEGTVVYAGPHVPGGTCTVDGNDYPRGYGNVVTIRHNGSTTYYTHYGHLSSVSVANNSPVAKGAVLGTMGSTGCSTGLHVHFQVGTCLTSSAGATFVAPGCSLWNGSEPSTGTPVSTSGLVPGVYPGLVATGSPPVQQAQTISFASLPNRVYGEPAFGVSASATSQLPVSFTAGPAGVCSVNGSTVSVLGVGTCSVTASQAGNESWLAAPNVTQMFQITPAPTTTTLTSEPPGQVEFGDTLTLRASVTANPPSLATPTGSVTFAEGADVLAADVPLGPGGASVELGALRPGEHTFTATYGGGTNFQGSSGSTTVSVVCRTTITGSVASPLTVKRSTCIQPGARIEGPITVKPGAALAVDDARIDGPITANGAKAILVCAARVGGGLTIKGTQRFLVIGDEASGCDGNRINGPVSLAKNAGPVALEHNRIGGWTSVSDGLGESLIADNEIFGWFSCRRNSPPPSNGGSSNEVSGYREGQCRSPDF
jgi:hypothetical protein